MPITARADDGGVIRAFDRGITEAACRDRDCGAKVIAVKPHIVDDVLLRVAHWRHATSSERTCPSHRDDQDRMTAWHLGFQNEADDPNRIEVPIHGKRADLVTRFGWIIEVQHSGIAPKTVADRENAHRGQVLWLVDGATNAAPYVVTPRPGSVEIQGPAWMHRVRTLIAVDDGDHVWVLPRYAQQWRRGDALHVPANLCTRMTRADFVAAWINGDRWPLDQQAMRTQWVIESRRPKTPKKVKTEAEIKRVEDDWRCGFTGDRGNLITASCQVCGQTAVGLDGFVCDRCKAVADKEPDPAGSVELLRKKLGAKVIGTYQNSGAA